MRVATLAALISSSAAAPNLHVAAYKDDVNVIQDQLRLGVDVNLKSDEGDRALHVAVAKGSVNAVAALLEAGAGPVDEVIEEDGRTLLDFARDKAKEGRQHKKVLKLLIDAADEEAWLDEKEPPTTEIPLKFEFKDVKSGTRPRSDTPAEESKDETLQAQIAKKFAALDANADGLLDPEEMRAAEEEVKAAEQKSGGTNMGGTPADLYAQARRRRRPHLAGGAQHVAHRACAAERCGRRPRHVVIDQRSDAEEGRGARCKGAEG